MPEMCLDFTRSCIRTQVFECSSIEARDKARAHKMPGETSIRLRVWGLGFKVYGLWFRL
jgi:hypothetical protein